VQTGRPPYKLSHARRSTCTNYVGDLNNDADRAKTDALCFCGEYFGVHTTALNADASAVDMYRIQRHYISPSRPSHRLISRSCSFNGQCHNLFGV